MVFSYKEVFLPRLYIPYMFKEIRTHFYIRLFCGLMALYLFNCSVDAPDAFAEYLPENVLINDQDSIVEIIVEQLLGFDDAITEYDDSEDGHGYTAKKTFATDIFILPVFTVYSLNFNTDCNTIKGRNENLHLIPYFEIHSPPPEV